VVIKQRLEKWYQKRWNIRYEKKKKNGSVDVKWNFIFAQQEFYWLI